MGISGCYPHDPRIHTKKNLQETSGFPVHFLLNQYQSIHWCEIRQGLSDVFLWSHAMKRDIFQLFIGFSKVMAPWHHGTMACAERRFATRLRNSDLQATLMLALSWGGHVDMFGINGDFFRFWSRQPLVFSNVYSLQFANWKLTIFDLGKSTNYKCGMFNSYM